MRFAFQKKRRAVILVLSLWMVLVLSLLAYSLAVEMRVEMKLTRGFRSQFCAEQLTRIGVSRAMADLRNDRLIDFGRNNGIGEVFDALGDVWSGTSVPRKYEVKDAGQYSTFVVDEGSKIDLNSNKAESRDLLRYLLIVLKVDEKRAQNLVDAIWDWKDSNDKPIAAGVDAEMTETDYYTEMLREIAKTGGSSAPVESVHPKNSKFDTVDELLQIPGMTPQLFYGYDPSKEEDPPFFPVAASGPGKKRMPGLRDLVTVDTDRLNVNTAGLEVLTALCACSTKDMSSARSMAEKIIAYRQGGKTKKVSNNRAFRKLEDLMQVSSVTAGVMASMVAAVPGLTTESENFTIYCEAEFGKARQQVYSSSGGSSGDEVLPSARAVVACNRSILVYAPDAFKKQKPPPACRRAVETRVGISGYIPTELQWFVPVIYVKRWISE